MPAPQATHIRLFLVDDHPIFLEGIKEILGQQKGLSVIGEANDGGTAIREAKKLRPDVVLLDIGLPDITGFEVFLELHPLLPETKFLVLTVHGNEGFREEFKKAGASGYLVKSTPPALLAEAIRKAHANETYFPDVPPEKPIVIPSFVPSMGGQIPRGALPENNLTTMERSIARLLISGLAPNRIAQKLNMSYHTVHTHLKHIYKKLGVQSRGEAVAKLLHIPPVN